MLSRSAVGKLKAILIIDLIIVAFAAGAYLYLLDRGEISTGATKPATFVLYDLTVTPQEAYVGESVTVSVNVTNIGDIEGSVLLELLLNGAVDQTQNITLAGLKTSQIVEFPVIKTTAGNYSVQIGNQYGSFKLKEASPESSKIVLSNIKSTPYESWANETVAVTVSANNPSAEEDNLYIRVTVDGQTQNSTTITLAPGESQTLTFNVNASTEGKHIVKVNTLQGSFTIVKTGYHTLTINRSGGGSKSLPITLNGVEHGTPFQDVLPVGEYSVSVPSPFDVGTGVLAFSYWSDGSHSTSRTFTLSGRLILVATYTLISGYASCPSLYVWNGTGYSYITDVSNSGWLGYIGGINHDGSIVFKDGNPYDYVKLDNSLKAKNGYYDLTLSQQWDELFYLDQAYLLAVDHPAGTDAYMSMTSYLSDGSTGRVYTTTNPTTTSPISAINEKGQNVLPQILTKDGIFTPGINGDESKWNDVKVNQLTLNLGDLSRASEVKLLINGMVDWGPAETYYKWIDSFKTAAAQGLVSDGTQIMPAPYIEVKAANGTWIQASRDIPLPSDYRSRTYTVNITGIFPKDVSSYEIRFNNFWNVTYDYIGIDTSTQANINVQTIKPTSADFNQLWDTDSNSTGNFTRYGDVTELLQNTDDIFVIGRQGDQVNMQFAAANLKPVAPGMVRDYFFVVSCWFKDPPGAWGYGFNFTVEKLPFLNMSGYPYPANESYPYDAEHLAYLAKYNTRVIS